MLLSGKVSDLNEFLVNTALPQSDRAVLSTGSEASPRQVPFYFQRSNRIQPNRVQLLDHGLSKNLPGKDVLHSESPHEDLFV